MLQYIINATAIWLVGLIVFDMFLGNEANHGYNRFYLLAIMFAGALIPLWSWDYDSVIYTTDVSRPLVEQSAVVKQTIVAASESTVLGWEQWLMIIYATGMGIFTLLLLKDLLGIIRLFRTGVKSKDGTWTIIETGKAQSPFSAFRYVFISSKDNYTAEELQMILAHEEQHGHLLHFIDVLLIRVASILFWFNPMIYLLEQRLLLVHEYQADTAVANSPSAYGKFLVEQSVLGSAPVLAHSFTRSPLKKRIIMLTKKTTTLAKGKQFILIPVLLIALLGFTKNSFSWEEPQRNGNKVIYRGNTIEFSEKSPSDTMMMKDPKTGEVKMIITTIDPKPQLINGKKIYTPNELEGEKGQNRRYTKPSAYSSAAMKEYLLGNMKKELKKLDDGDYRLIVENIVMDNKGKLAYFEFGGLKKVIKLEGARQKTEDIDKKTEEKFAKKIALLINSAPSHSPAVYDGNEVNSSINNWDFYNSFSIKDKELVSL